MRSDFLCIFWIAYWQWKSGTAITENAYQLFCYPGEIIYVIMIHMYILCFSLLDISQAIQFAEQALIFADMYIVALSPLGRN